MNIPDEIERVALLGWCVAPASRTSRASCIKNAVEKASCDLDTIAYWCEQFPACNWRVYMGPSELWGLDLDVPSMDHKADGVAAFVDLAKCYPPLPRCPTTRSGGGGNAVFYRWQGEAIAGKTGWPAPGIDPRRGAQSVTIPPSIHLTTGNPYIWESAPWEVNPPTAPAWLLKMMAPPPVEAVERPNRAPDDVDAKRILDWAVRSIREAPRGAANDTLNRAAHFVARWVGAHLMGEAEAVQHLAGAADDRRIPRPEARATIKSAFAKGLANPMAPE